MENFIVLFVIGVAAAYVSRVFYQNYQRAKNLGRNGCECGCSSCNISKNLSDECDKKI